MIEHNPGGYLLGATLPDVHIISEASREDTHFSKLERPFGESGVKGFFQAYSSLDTNHDIAPNIKIIVAGYLSHLVTDETWIEDIYQPFFSTCSPQGGTPLANLMDRVLQYELDCRERQDKVKMIKIQTLLSRWDPIVSLDFLPTSLLIQWHIFICAATGREPTWERFPLFAQKFLLPKHKVDPKQLEEFLASLPPQEEQIFNYVPKEHVQAFREKAISKSVAVVKEYLN